MRRRNGRGDRLRGHRQPSRLHVGARHGARSRDGVSALPLTAGPASRGQPASRPVRTWTRRPGPPASAPSRRRIRDITITIENPDLCPRYAGARRRRHRRAVARLDAGAPARPAASARSATSSTSPTTCCSSSGSRCTRSMLATAGEARDPRPHGARRRALKTLDGQDARAAPDMLVIADAERPVAHRRRDGRRRLRGRRARRGRSCFESAYFNPLSVRRTSKQLGLKTEASMRFERGADPRCRSRRWSGPARCSSRSAPAKARGTSSIATRRRIEPRASLPLRRAAHRRRCSASTSRTPTSRASSTSLGFALRDGAGWLGRHRADPPRRRRRARSI